METTNSLFALCEDGYLFGFLSYFNVYLWKVLSQFSRGMLLIYSEIVGRYRSRHNECCRRLWIEWEATEVEEWRRSRSRKTVYVSHSGVWNDLEMEFCSHRIPSSFHLRNYQENFIFAMVLLVCDVSRCLNYRVWLWMAIFLIERWFLRRNVRFLTEKASLGKKTSISWGDLHIFPKRAYKRVNGSSFFT